jgi:uroporphyrinogen decarboxylase
MDHRESDKVPTDLWLDSSNPNVKITLMDYVSKYPYEDLLDYLDIDIYRFKPEVSGKYKNFGGITKFFLPVTDERMLSFSKDSVQRPLLDIEDPKDLDALDWPTGEIFDYSNFEAILESEKRRILWAQAGTWSPMFCKMCDLCGIEKVLLDLLTNPDFIDALAEKILAFYEDSFRRTLEASKGRLDVFGFGDDFATQNSLMFNIKLWHRFFKEPMRRLVKLIKSYDVYVAFHSCGAISDIIPDFINMGVDILFPIQPRAAGMEASRLKRDFGKDIVFYGGIDVQHILPFGTEQDVRDEVDRVSGILAKDGGYILASSHGILKDIPPANIIAMYDEINTLGQKTKTPKREEQYGNN